MSESSSDVAALFWCLFWFFVWAILLSVALASGRDGSGVGGISDPPSSVRDWIDTRAAIAISRRPRVRKRRHRH